MLEIVAGPAIAFVVLLVLFRLLEWLRQPDRKLWRRGFATDVAWFAFTPLVTKAITRFGVGLALVPPAYLIYGAFDPELIRQGYGPASRLQLWLQAFLILLIGDFIGYWMHRLFHRPRLWPFHAVHHSSVDLDWLSAVRVHPVNDLLMRVAGVLPLVALGFAPLAVGAILPILTLLAILVHANVDWDFGPLRAVIVSPRFHRWHHTDESSARDKNFAGLFPIWDLLFGTWYMPRDAVPSSFGTSTPVPGHFLGQLWFPFRRRLTRQA
jgi:sterol desaturase/sphingolipid hydroxylase (fatty acid hydroxylase superfamily)